SSPPGLSSIAPSSVEAEKLENDDDDDDGADDVQDRVHGIYPPRSPTNAERVPPADHAGPELDVLSAAEAERVRRTPSRAGLVGGPWLARPTAEVGGPKMHGPTGGQGDALAHERRMRGTIDMPCRRDWPASPSRVTGPGIA